MPKASVSQEDLKIVYVHGIGNQPAPAVLKRQWDQALFAIDMGAKTRIAYWADIRYPQPAPSADTEGLPVPLREAHHVSARVRSDAGFLEDVIHDAPYGREAERYATAVGQKLLTSLRRAPARTRRVEAEVLPDLIRRPVMELIAKTFIQDTAAYFFDPAQRAEIQNRLAQILSIGPGPYIVVGHSQGSIIAYDVLRMLEDSGTQVPLFITIGSPLGIDEVQDHLQKPLKIPKGVEEWHNFVDPVDPVATLDRTFRDEFAGQVPLVDHEVINRDTLRIIGFNPHSATGYLATTEVRQTVSPRVPAGFVTPVAPFVIARDVATEMADPTLRIPVLIELKPDEPGATLATIGKTLEQELRRLEREFKKHLPDDVDRDADYFKIDVLRRYIGADLTAEEIDLLAARHSELSIVSVWKNSGKRALLERSGDVVQAKTAQLGYGAIGHKIGWAILDTGIAARHPHFETHKNIVAEWDCTKVGKPVKGAPDADGHGTHVAGIIAGVGQKANSNRSGMAPKAELHIYKVLDDSGSGKDSWIIKALDHIADINDRSFDLVIHGVNLSLGGPFDEAVFGCGFSPICRELHRLWRQGVAVCVAAGNEGHLVINTEDGEARLNLDLSVGDPANLEEAIAVGSVHRDFPHLYGISYFSSRGPTADGRAKPDVVAPGERIMSCNRDFKKGDAKSEYISMSGTSMACPHVSGLIAAFLSVRREFIGSPDRVKEVLMANCTDLRRDRYHQGAGMPNLVKMLMAT